MSDEHRVWVVDDDRAIRWVLERALTREGFAVVTFDKAADVLSRLERELPVALLVDVRMPGMSGLELLATVTERYPELPIIIMTAHSDLDSALAAYQGGAFEYLPKPFDVVEATQLVRRAATSHISPAATSPSRPMPEIIGEAPAMQDVFRVIGRLSNTSMTVLINGESGTGKELVARALHRHGPRAQRPFIALNMAAVPRDLMESELFGHEKGAFTGAQNVRQGRFEQADGGTLFLDEIGDMSADLQTRLLRVLADGEFHRVGGHVPLKVDVRIVAATHQDLEQRVADGQFREDLFHRLNVIRIHLPALRERREDIPQLTRFLLDKVARELGTEPKPIYDDVVRHLSRQHWPGNVRQLENVCRWLTVMASGGEIRMDDLPPDLQAGNGVTAEQYPWERSLADWAAQALAAGGEDLSGEALPRFERILINAALTHTGGRRQHAAQLLGWGRNTLTRKINELGFDEGP